MTIARLPAPAYLSQQGQQRIVGLVFPVAVSTIAPVLQVMEPRMAKINALAQLLRTPSCVKENYQLGVLRIPHSVSKNFSSFIRIQTWCQNFSV